MLGGNTETMCHIISQIAVILRKNIVGRGVCTWSRNIASSSIHAPGFGPCNLSSGRWSPSLTLRSKRKPLPSTNIKSAVLFRLFPKIPALSSSFSPRCCLSRWLWLASLARQKPSSSSVPSSSLFSPGTKSITETCKQTDRKPCMKAAAATTSYIRVVEVAS